MDRYLQKKREKQEEEQDEGKGGSYIRVSGTERGGDWMRTIGKRRVELSIVLGNMVYNLFRYMQGGQSMTSKRMKSKKDRRV